MPWEVTITKSIVRKGGSVDLVLDATFTDTGFSVKGIKLALPPAGPGRQARLNAFSRQLNRTKDADASVPPPDDFDAQVTDALNNPPSPPGPPGSPGRPGR